MSKMKTWGGFSMVEMMLLLLVTSLMLASAVTVITKKHVKVPKIAMHGAYMCYMKNGQLHEEQYVGSNLRKKTLDRDVANCNFTPPERASYLHIQAIGGGGGGGDSGYTGGNNQRFESATEVMSPFGITAAILDLKGIPDAEFKELGGKVYAYAMAEDAGKGGDLYYIKEDCAAGNCLVWRDWVYNGTQERECKFVSSNISYNSYNYTYDYDCTVYCSGSGCDAGCGSYGTKYCGGPSCTGCNTYNTESCSIDCDNCNNGKGVAGHWDENKNWIAGYTSCGSGSTNNTTTCSSGWDYDYNNCISGGLKNSTCQSTCTETIDEPFDADCAVTGYKKLTVNTTDTYAKDTSENPPYRIKDKDAELTNDEKEVGLTPKILAMKEREVKRDKETLLTICNYGNPAKFKGVDGIFGTFNSNDNVGVPCDTLGIMTAFGDDIFPMGDGAKTVLTTIELFPSSKFYTKALMYDLSETYGLDRAYGTSCINAAVGAPVCDKTWKSDTPYKAPGAGGISYPTTESLYTECTINSSTYTKSTTHGCEGKSNVRNQVRIPQSKTVKTASSCVRKNSSGKYCMYNYNSSKATKGVCQYIPAMVAGGKAGTGTKCRTAAVSAAVGLNYVGNSSVIPGIRGSDINCTGAGYKPLYTKDEWSAQPSCYAENGTDAVGSSVVTITGSGTYSCTANAVAPTQGKGARKTGTGATTPTAGKASTTDGTVLPSNATRDTGCGTQHVGYCLIRHTNTESENGKYTYKYSWTTNYLQYGEGGKAGQYRAMVMRTSLDRPLAITIGQGGAGGANETGNSGENGGTTLVGDIVRAEGGKGGPGGFITPVEQLPNWYAGGVYEKGWNGTMGESANVSNFKGNILNLVLPIDNSVLGQWLAASGAGGDGGGSRNNCWASEWVRWFEGKKIRASIEEEDITCRRPGMKYWSATPNATAGAPGAVLIKW